MRLISLQVSQQRFEAKQRFQILNEKLFARSKIYRK